MRAGLKVLFVALFVSLAVVGSAEARCGDRAITRPDLITLLPTPPSPGSDADRADHAALVELQKARTPELAARVEADRPIDAFRFADVIGPEFNRETLPATAALLDRLDDYVKAPIAAAKDFWCRPRPKPGDGFEPLFRSRGSSYPSGHNAFGRFAAIILSELYPEKRAALFARGDVYGDARIQAGVHYPSDAAAGRLAGTLIAQVALADPSFVVALERARDEIRLRSALD
ncbi:phosphatase PAP2 family protein [Methylopila sp. M107]|uniref:phosphatase PAP2 family protein n=1 Tax=Methylopila sp. M107 TaxID=1101190 RepID=UPI00036E6F30|nr:phosphatase PAP2 family protein [Methylopila sp. M107]